ncbi:unnamed protein product [Closterium sp. NIES-53]
MGPFRSNSRRPPAVLALVTITFATLAASPAFAGKIRQVFAFGDQAFDTGMSRFFSQSIWKATAPPYGQDWGKISGRFSNGRLVLDFITFRLGLPSLFAYHRKPLVSKQGTSFATAAAGARNWVYAGKTRSLQTQIAYMQEYKDKRKNNPQVMLDQSLIMISAGTNDYVLALLGQSDGQSVEQVLSATTGAIVKAVQDLNAMTKTTKIVVFDVPPLGCIPAVRYFKKTPARQCDAAANKIADQHNTGVRVKLEKLRKQGVTNLILFKQSTVYRVKGTTAGGFIDQTSVCCEGKTPSGKLIACGQTVKEGGKSYSATACKDPTKYVWWDWYNPTEAFNEVLSGILWHSNSVSYVSPFGLKAIVDK